MSGRALKALCCFMIVGIVAVMISFYQPTYGLEGSLRISGVGSLLTVVPDSEGGFFILSDCGGEYKIIRLYNDNSLEDYSVGIDCSKTLYAYCENYFYFMRISDTQVGCSADSIVAFKCSNATKKEIFINNPIVNSSRGFAADSNGLFYFPHDNTVDVYSSSGVYVKTIYANRDAANISSSFDGEYIYLSSFNELGIIRNSELTRYSIACDKVIPCEGNCFQTDCGEVYTTDGSDVNYRCSFEGAVGVGIVDGCFVGYSGGEIIAVNDDGERSIFGLSEPKAICSSNNRCACFVQNGDSLDVTFVESDDVSVKISAYASDRDASVSSHTSSGSADNTASKTEYSIKSTVLAFDESAKTVTGISPSTTIAQIKASISYSGCTLQFTDSNGGVKTSGTIGTGGAVNFCGSGKTLTYTIIIYGDLTGEGNVNSNDKNRLYDHLLGSSVLRGEELEAADINDDGCADLRDLVALSQYLNGKYQITQRRTA